MRKTDRSNILEAIERCPVAASETARVVETDLTVDVATKLALDYRGYIDFPGGKCNRWIKI